MSIINAKPGRLAWGLAAMLVGTSGWCKQNLTLLDFPEQVVDNRQGLSESTMFPQIRTMHVMVAGGNNFVTEAGLRILRAGGNAVDAGVAATLAAAVTEEDHFSMGGEMPVLIKMKNKPVEVVSGVGVAPRLANRKFYLNRSLLDWEKSDRKPPIPSVGILATTTPGMVDGALLALKNYGTMRFEQVAMPAIELADAFPTTEILAKTLARDAAMLRRWPTSAHYFLQQNGDAPNPGDLFYQPTLANTLRAMVAAEKEAKGNREKRIDAVRDYFYRGPVARKMASFSEKNGGLLRYEDMAKFHADIENPVSITFHGYEIIKPGFWTQGPVLLETLNLLETYDLNALGHNTPEYIHVLTEALKLAFADRDKFYGDPNFSKIPQSILLSKDYAYGRGKLINLNRASMRSQPGDIPGYGGPLPHEINKHINVKDTTNVAVVDSNGNVYVATPSGAWSPGVIAGDTGIAFGTRLQSFVLDDGSPNMLMPGKRPRITLSPTLVLKNGQPVMALTTPGGDNQDQALLQVLLNIIVFGMSPQQAVEAPRFQTNALHASFGTHDYSPGDLSLENRISTRVVDALRAKGHVVKVRGAWSNGSAPVVIKLNEKYLEGGADPRRGRFVDGY